MATMVIKSSHKSGQVIYWRRKSKDTQPSAGVVSAQAADSTDFQFDEMDAHRVDRFLDKNLQLEVEIVPIDSDELADCVREEIEQILNSTPAVISVPMEPGMLYPLDYDIEGMYLGSIRDAELEGLAVETEEEEVRSFDVFPSVELPQVKPGIFFEEGSKTDQVLQILKPYLPERKVEFIIGGQAMARPVLVDEDGRLLAGIADCLHADSLNIDVQTYSVKINQQVSDRDRAYILLDDVSSVVNLSEQILAQIMVILCDDLKPQTGKCRSDSSALMPDEEMAEKTGISPHKTERAATLARKMKGESQTKNFGSIPPSKAEQINARVDVAAKLIQRILDRFDKTEAELFVRNRLRSELQQRMSVLCTAVKAPRSKK